MASSQMTRRHQWCVISPDTSLQILLAEWLHRHLPQIAAGYALPPTGHFGGTRSLTQMRLSKVPMTTSNEPSSASQKSANLA